MCANYTPTRRDRWVEERVQVQWPQAQSWPAETYPGLIAPIVLLDPASGAPSCQLARFGLIPFWAKDASIGRRAYNARSETAYSKPSFRAAWRERRYALALMDDFFEMRWTSALQPGADLFAGEPGSATPIHARAQRWRISRTDGEPLVAACLWERWTDPQSGELATSFSMLTVNADQHALMRQFHKPEDEKRMPVLLPVARCMDWLRATAQTAAPMMLALPADELVAQAAPRV